jgi:hypothetical protein
MDSNHDIFPGFSIDDDILKLVDELNIDEFVKEASVALEDDALLRQFFKDKATIAIERFLDYIPKLSIPVEKRDLPDGWTITCRASDGGHLKLKDLVIKVRSGSGSVTLYQDNC